MTWGPLCTRLEETLDEDDPVEVVTEEWEDVFPGFNDLYREYMR
jgi:hypothetical protein